jgi:predicted N-acetyltransferase YhbS
MRGSFADDPALFSRIFDLLDAVFPGIRGTAENVRRLGTSWESVSTPFVHFEGGRAVAHVGVIELRLVLLGQTVPVGSIHAVATHPLARRRGLYRRVMEEALAHCSGRYGTLVLTTEHPEYFEPFGFRHVREHYFACPPAPRLSMSHRPPPRAGDGGGLRLLDTAQANDVELLHRLLATREPVSEVVGVVDERAVFCFNEGRRPLRYAPDLDVIVCMERHGTRLTLYDVVGPRIPALDLLLERVPEPISEVELCFGADRLAPSAEAIPYLLDHDGPSYLMVRGPFAPEGKPFTLPRSART